MKSAIQLIRETDRGNLLNDFEGALEEIVKAIEDNNGGKGEITLTFKISSKAGQGDALTVSGDVKHKVPKRKRLDAIFFFDADEGELTRRDPRQPTMPSVVDADEINERRRRRDIE